MKRKILYTLILMTQTLLVNSQDINFSMFEKAYMSSNTAHIATNNQAEINFIQRNQWKGIDARFRSILLSIKYPFVKLRDNVPHRWGGLGLAFLNDSQGDGLLKTVGGELAFAYNFNLKKNRFISLAVKGGFFQRYIDESKLVSGFDANYNPTFYEVLSDNYKNFPTLGTGIMFYKEMGYPSNEKIYYISLDASHLNSPNISFFNQEQALALRLTSIGGYRVYRSQKYSIVPNYRVINQGNAYQVNVGSYFNYHFSEYAGALFRYGTIGLGTWYSVDNAVVASIEFNSPTFTAGFSYDFNTSQLRKLGNAGATEFTFSIKKTIGRPKDIIPNFDDEDIEEIPTIEDVGK